MKFLRFRYILPFFLFVVSGLSMIAYAAITFDLDESGIWYGPNNPPHTNPTAFFEKDLDFTDYQCPAAVPTGCVSDCGGPGGPGDGDPMDPIIVTPSLPPPSTGYQNDTF